MNDTLWEIGKVLVLAGIFAGQVVICRKWGKWYILPILLSLPMLYYVCVYMMAFQLLAMLLLPLAFLVLPTLLYQVGQPLVALVAATIVGMSMWKQREQAEAEMNGLPQETASVTEGYYDI